MLRKEEDREKYQSLHDCFKQNTIKEVFVSFKALIMIVGFVCFMVILLILRGVGIRVPKYTDALEKWISEIDDEPYGGLMI